MWRVIDRLYLGTNTDASNLYALEGASITHIVTCAAELASHFPLRFVYHRLELKDPDESLSRRIAEANQFIDTGRQIGNVLVHCNGAVSRSPAVVLAYMCHLGHSLTHASKQMATILPTRPSEVFLR